MLEIIIIYYNYSSDSALDIYIYTYIIYKKYASSYIV